MLLNFSRAFANEISSGIKRIDEAAEGERTPEGGKPRKDRTQRDPRQPSSLKIMDMRRRACCGAL